MLVIGAYLVIGIAAYWPVLPGISGKIFSVDGDFSQSVWFIGWASHALTHGLNPFFSNAMYAPSGVNLAQNTASPLLGWLTAPLSLVLSPLVVGNLLMVLAMPVSATAAFVVLRKWEVWWPAAALGGLIYGFSPYMVAQGTAHVELLFVPLPPFIALTLASILQGKGPPRRLGIQLGLLLTAQYLISPEVLSTVVILIFVAVICVVVRNPSAVPTLARTAARPLAIAVGLSAVLLVYPFWMLLAGPQHFTGRAWPISNPFHNDLLSLGVPGPLQKDSLGTGSLGARLIFPSNVTEGDGYIGIPLLIVTGILAWHSRRSPRTQLAGVLFLGAALLSLGPYLEVDGRLTHFPLPFLLIDHLPLVDNLLPSRISFEMDACLAALIAFGLDDLHRVAARSQPAGSPRQPKARKWWAGVFAAVTLVVLLVTQLPSWPYPAPAADGLPASIRQAIPTGDPVAVTYPYAYFPFTQPLLWQADGGFDFRLLGGYARHADYNGSGAGSTPIPMSPPGMQQFLVREDVIASSYFARYASSVRVSPKLVASTRTALSKYHIRLVIVDRSAFGSRPIMKLFNDALGPPSVSADHFSMWADWHGSPRR